MGVGEAMVWLIPIAVESVRPVYELGCVLGCGLNMKRRLQLITVWAVLMIDRCRFTTIAEDE